MESTVTLNLRFVKRCHERPRSNSGCLFCLGFQQPKFCLQHSHLSESRSDHLVTPTRLLPPNICTRYTPSPTFFFFFFLAYVSHFLPVVLKAGIREVLVGLVPAAGCGKGSPTGPSPWPVVVIFSLCACLGATVSVFLWGWLPYWTGAYPSGLSLAQLSVNMRILGLRTPNPFSKESQFKPQQSSFPSLPLTNSCDSSMQNTVTPSQCLLAIPVSAVTGATSLVVQEKRKYFLYWQSSMSEYTVTCSHQIEKWLQDLRREHTSS